MDNRHALSVQDGGSSGHKPLHINHEVADEEPSDWAPAEQVTYFCPQYTSARHETGS